MNREDLLRDASALLFRLSDERLARFLATEGPPPDDDAPPPDDDQASSRALTPAERARRYREAHAAEIRKRRPSRSKGTAGVTRTTERPSRTVTPQPASVTAPSLPRDGLAVTPRDGLVTAFRDGPVTTLARAPESSDAFSPVNSDKKLEIPSVRPSLPERARDGLAVTPRDGPDVTQGRHGVVTPQPASVTAPTVTTPNPGGTDGRTDGLSVLSLPDVQAIVKRRSGGKINTRLIGTAEDGFAGVLAQLERQNCTLEDFGVLADMVLTGDLEREYRGQLSLQAMLGRPDDRGNYSAGGLDAALQIASKCALRRKAKGLPPRMPPVRTQPKGPAPIKTPAQPVLPTAALGAIASDWRAKHNRPAGGGQ